jgi:hypothetical protein
MKKRTMGSDMIIGMTLAEVFLLLLIVGWYGSRLESEASGRDPGTPAESLQQKLDEANKALKVSEEKADDLEKKNKTLQDILFWIGGYVHSGQPITDLDSAKTALGGYTLALKRGKPVCADANVLVQVVADNDKLGLTVLQPLTVENQDFTAGQSFEDRDLDRFLAAVQKYYSGRRAANRDCAFDFRLDWRTDHDYRTAKQRFDQYFYPAAKGERQLQ